MNLKSLYMHFPFCRHLCNYCDFHKSILNDQTQINELETLLEDSFLGHHNFLEENGYKFAPLETFYLGGGTPSLWGESGSHFLKKLFEKYQMKIPKSREYTLEVNPGAWTDASLKSFQDFGINRYSLGIQSLDSRFIKELDRIHTIKDVFDTLEYFSKNQLNFSVDFMLGLPFSKEYQRDILKELTEILKFDPNHLSLYILTTKSSYIHQNHLPSDEYIANEYMKVSNFLKSKGYHHYEVSNFSKPNMESKHNIMYWKSEGVAAIGPSATGLLPASKIRYKWKNQTSKFSIELLSEEEMSLENFYMKLRTNLGMNLLESGEYYKCLSLLADNFKEKNWVQVEGNMLYPTSLGFLMVDSMMDEIFKLQNKVILTQES